LELIREKSRIEQGIFPADTFTYLLSMV